MDEAKIRVELELKELGEKLSKLVSFTCSDKYSDLSRDMQYLLQDQIRCMLEYCNILRRRLAIWCKTNEELHTTKESSMSIM